MSGEARFDVEGFLLELESGSLLGQFQVQATAPGHVGTLSDRVDEIAEHVQSQTRDEACRLVGNVL